MTGRDSVTIGRRDLLAGLAALPLLSLAAPAEAAHPGITVGAIRWDAWYAAGAIRDAVATALAPDRWSDRAPACATAAAGAARFAACGTQAQIDREIAAARAAKLDYWAYCWYGADHPMQQAWRLHQASRHAADMRWCAIFSSFARFSAEVATATASLLQRANYQTVLGNRPLVYLLAADTRPASFAADLRTFRAGAAAAGRGDPYIVLLTSTVAAGLAQGDGVDALGTYAKGSPTPVAGRYADLAKLAEDYWPMLAAAKRAIVPTAMTGWDRRPRIEHPVPWEARYQRANAGDDHYFAAGTPSAIAAHIADMIRWVRSHPAASPARTGLIYSWDEHDEGGSTLAPSRGDGGRILAAVGRAL